MSFYDRSQFTMEVARAGDKQTIFFQELPWLLIKKRVARPLSCSR
jgi:hypothetical protein